MPPFNPFSGQFESRSVATLDPVVYKTLTDNTQEVSDETAFVKEHVVKNKQHLREVKSRLRELETAISELQADASVLELSEAMNADALEARLDKLEKDQNLILKAVEQDIKDILQEVEELKNKKAPSMVAVKIDESIQMQFTSLETKLKMLKEGTDFSAIEQAEDKAKLEAEIKNLKTKFMWSVYISIATTAVIIALKILF